VPVSGSGPVSAQQYVVYVNGNSPMLLEHIRQITPDAFLSTVEGRSVIQVGRFDGQENAQLRVNELRAIGVGATVRSAEVVVPLYPTPGRFEAGAPTGSGALPPLPVAIAPSGGSGTIPPPPATRPVAVETHANPSPPPAAAAASSAGYYVVVPGGRDQLPSLADQMVQLGAPAGLLQPRLSPRGPHVAYGPFRDRSLAEQWRYYLRGSGLDARVHHQ
jgi:hypothetical protein